MVKNHPLLVALSVILVSMMLVGITSAWTGTYHLNQEWVKIWINQNGTIDLFYNISITLDSGDNINRVFIGQPQRDFTIDTAKDQYGHTLTATDKSSGSDYKVQVDLHSPLKVGQTIWFTLITNVAHMIYKDTQYNVGMKFNATWWPEARLQDLRISIVLPSGVTEDMVETLLGVNWNGTGMGEGR